MEYITEVIEYVPKTNAMAKKIEERSNEMAASGYALVTATCTGSAQHYAR